MKKLLICLMYGAILSTILTLFIVGLLYLSKSIPMINYTLNKAFGYKGDYNDNPPIKWLNVFVGWLWLTIMFVLYSYSEIDER